MLSCAAREYIIEQPQIGNGASIGLLSPRARWLTLTKSTCPPAEVAGMSEFTYRLLGDCCCYHAATPAGLAPNPPKLPTIVNVPSAWTEKPITVWERGLRA